jgi:hypothetical protein
MRGVPGGGFPDCRALLYLARAVGRKLRVHGGCTWSTEHPSTEARHEEEDHQGNRRDSEVTVCAVRTFRPSYPSLKASFLFFRVAAENCQTSTGKDTNPCF